MNRGLSVELILHAGVLVALSVAAHRFSPHYVAATLFVGLAGGLLSGLLGGLGLLGRGQRRWAIGVMTVLSLALLVPVFGTWQAIRASVEPLKPASLIPLLASVLTVVQLVNLIQNRGDRLFGVERDRRDPNRQDHDVR